MLFTRGVWGACSRLVHLARLPYNLARVGGAEPYLAHVAVIAEVVEFLGIRVLPAARDREKRQAKATSNAQWALHDHGTCYLQFESAQIRWCQFLVFLLCHNFIAILLVWLSNDGSNTMKSRHVRIQLSSTG